MIDCILHQNPQYSLVFYCIHLELLFTSRIKDVSPKIEDLKINISKAIVIYALNNLDSQFQSYFAILSYNAREKEKLPILSELTRTLEDEQMYLSNENRRTANYAYSSKPKKVKPIEQGERASTEKKSDNKGEKKK